MIRGKGRRREVSLSVSQAPARFPSTHPSSTNAPLYSTLRFSQKVRTALFFSWIPIDPMRANPVVHPASSPVELNPELPSTIHGGGSVTAIPSEETGEREFSPARAEHSRAEPQLFLLQKCTCRVKDARPTGSYANGVRRVGGKHELGVGAGQGRAAHVEARPPSSPQPEHHQPPTASESATNIHTSISTSTYISAVSQGLGVAGLHMPCHALQSWEEIWKWVAPTSPPEFDGQHYSDRRQRAYRAWVVLGN
ncbi:hypothetical protein BKA64DRAFT_752619 [Cadophora sp. MPI-SDFR-AT-0126]|nr:hypothetical protein BKA64DRAFT_752619 [Leotiomycetes sp. MPI-SDFR-AT-0126]